MTLVQRSEVLGLGDYEQIRPQFRARVIADKRARRIEVCPEVSALFENHDTVLFQIQEMLRTERISQETGIQHEIDTYNDLVPGPAELSATMFVEIPEAEVRERRLVELAGLEGHIALDVGGTVVRGRNETRGVLPDRTTAVHYVKFPLGGERAARWRRAVGGEKDATFQAFWLLDHPRLSVRKELSPEMLKALAADFDP